MAKSNLQYTKGERTRFFNVLDKEIKNGSNILGKDYEYISAQEQRSIQQEVDECKTMIIT